MAESATSGLRDRPELTKEELSEGRWVVRDWLGYGRADETTLNHEIDALLRRMAEVFGRKGA